MGKAIVLVIAILLIVMWYTNPTKEDYDKYIDNVAKLRTEETTGITKLSKMITNSGSAFLIKKFTGRKDYFIFSIYEFKMTENDTPVTHIGVFKILFIEI